MFANFGFKISKISTKSVIHSNTTDAFKIQKHLIKDSNKELIIFDIGAHVGGIALKYNELFLKSKIFCFEPFLESFLELEQKTYTFKNIIAFNKGLSDREGFSKFYSNCSAPTNSLLKAHASSELIWGKGLLDNLGTVDIELTTIDNFVLEYHIEMIDILKMDVQGAEFKVLKGAKKTFEKGIIKMIYTEIIMLPTYEGQMPFEETIKLIRSFGFELFNFYNHSLTNEGQLRQVDAIFIKSNT